MAGEKLKSTFATIVGGAVFYGIVYMMGSAEAARTSVEAGAEALADHGYTNVSGGAETNECPTGDKGRIYDVANHGQLIVCFDDRPFLMLPRP